MDISPHARATFQDGTHGRVERVVYDPRTKEVTHVVVHHGLLGEPRLVPISEVGYGDDTGVHLTMGQREFEDCDPFTEVELVPFEEAAEMGAVDVLALDPVLGSGSPFTLAWPYVAPTDEVPVEVERVTPGEVAFGRGTPVEASDGRVGHVGAFVVDWGSGHLTHLVLAHGHLWGHREIAVPLAAVYEIADGTVELSLSKEEVEALPDIPRS